MTVVKPAITPVDINAAPQLYPSRVNACATGDETLSIE